MKKPVAKSISVQIQNGKYKTKNFSQAFNIDTAGSPRLNLEYNSPSSFVHTRPNTTTNKSRARILSPKAGFKRILVGSTMSTQPDERNVKSSIGRRVETEDFRPSTSELRVRRGINVELDEFRGLPLLQGLGSRGLYKNEDERKEKQKILIKEDVRAEEEQEKLVMEVKLNELAGEGKLKSEWIEDQESKGVEETLVDTVEEDDVVVKACKQEELDISMEEMKRVVDMMSYKKV